MTPEQFEAGEAAIKRYKAIVADLEQLRAVPTPYGQSSPVWKDWNTAADILDPSLLREVVTKGVKAVIDELVAEQESLAFPCSGD
jgi:hypothetical protein